MSGLLPDDLEVARRLADARTAVMEATRHVHSPKRSTRYRATRNAIIAGAAILALTAGAIAVALASRETIDTNVFCYESPSLGSTVVSGQTEPGDFDPIGMCEAVWAYDLFTDGESLDDSHPVPDLVICTLPDGTAGVFPGREEPDEDFCAALGLADWDSD